MKRKMGLDWLRDYRLERGLSADPVVHQSAAPLLLKGSALGAVLVLIPVTLWIGLGIHQHRLQSDVAELAPVEARVGDAQSRLQSMAQKRQALNQQTNRIVAQLVALRSGSALLEQMRQVTPQGIRLLSVAALSSKLMIKGEAEGVDAFERINAFVLNLEMQQELHMNGTAVVQAKANEKGRIEFGLESAIDSSVRATPERLRELGSEGLARRYEVLLEQGFDL